MDIKVPNLIYALSISERTGAMTNDTWTFDKFGRWGYKQSDLSFGTSNSSSVDKPSANLQLHVSVFNLLCPNNYG